NAPDRIDSTQQALIVDAVHNGGDPLFYFLPPLVSSPRSSGVLDRALAPMVTIDRIDPRSGAILEQVRVFPSDGRDAERIRPASDGWTIRWRATQGSYRASVFT